MIINQKNIVYNKVILNIVYVNSSFFYLFHIAHGIFPCKIIKVNYKNFDEIPYFNVCMKNQIYQMNSVA